MSPTNNTTQGCIIENDRQMSRREARREDRRDTIIAVASESFFKKGYAATSMSAIASKLGGSKATLWNYFPSKEELFAAVIDQRTETYREQLTELLKPVGCVETTLANLSRSLLEKVGTPHAIALHRLIVAESHQFPELGRIFYERGPRMTTELLSEYVARAMERGELRNDDPETACRSFITLCIHSVQQRQLLGLIGPLSKDQIEAETERTVSVFMRAFGPDK